MFHAVVVLLMVSVHHLVHWYVLKLLNVAHLKYHMHDQFTHDVNSYTSQLLNKYMRAWSSVFLNKLKLIELSKC